MIICGIDPGAKGGAALLNFDRSIIIVKLLQHIEDLNRFLKMHAVTHVYMEKAQVFPKNGAVGMFNYGMAFGELIGRIHAANIPLELVSPATWTREMHAGTVKTKHKKLRSFEACRLIFPHVSLIPDGKRVPQDGLGEALLIAEYGRKRVMTKERML